jgi:predicted enzyme related to lactoylglutathione lyase
MKTPALPNLLVVALLLSAHAACVAGNPPLPPLTTESGSPRLPGKFVWADLVTDDVPAAQRFYSGLLGWTFRTTGGYSLAYSDDRPLAGMFQRERPKDKPDAKPRWFGYISVPSVAAAQRAVIEHGGKVVSAPAKFPKRGEQAVFTDPEGALFGVIKSSAGDPPDFLAEPGEWIWIQLLGRDARKAADFYRAIAGYQVAENTTANHLNDYILTSKGYARATVRRIPGDDPQVRPSWLPYVRVTNAKEAVARAEQLGGRVLIAPKPELLNGRVAVVADPTGAAIGLLEWSEDLLQGAGKQ